MPGSTLVVNSPEEFKPVLALAAPPSTVLAAVPFTSDVSAEVFEEVTSALSVGLPVPVTSVCQLTLSSVAKFPASVKDPMPDPPVIVIAPFISTTPFSYFIYLLAPGSPA